MTNEGTIVLIIGACIAMIAPIMFLTTSLGVTDSTDLLPVTIICMVVWMMSILAGVFLLTK